MKGTKEGLKRDLLEFIVTPWGKENLIGDVRILSSHLMTLAKRYAPLSDLSSSVGSEC